MRAPVTLPSEAFVTEANGKNSFTATSRTEMTNVQGRTIVDLVRFIETQIIGVTRSQSCDIAHSLRVA